MISWDMCRQEFEPDGSLRDIYVLGTGIELWRRFFDGLRSAYNLEYSVDGESCPIPESVDEAFSTRTAASPSLHFRVAEMVVACHFFCIEQIEMDLDPREVTSAADFDALLRLLRSVGETVSKPVIVTCESDQQHPFIIYQPDTSEFEYRKYEL
jgi:hypothetical protein